MTIAIVITITITSAIGSYSHHCATYRVIYLLFSDRTYVKSQSIERSTGSHESTSIGLKIQYHNEIELSHFSNPTKTKYMTSLEKIHLSKINPCKKSNK